MENNISLKILDQIRTALKYRDEPAIICSQSRVSCEAMLKCIWQNEYGIVPQKIMIQELTEGISRKSPNLIPKKIGNLIGTVQIYGNFASHSQGDYDQLDLTHGSIVESALTGICNWFFVDYLKQPAPENLINLKKEPSNYNIYRELLLSALNDKILEIDEFENIMDARYKLELEEDLANKIDIEIVEQVLNKKINHLSDILNTSDLNTYQKFDERKLDYSPWVANSIQQINENKEKLHCIPFLLQHYLKDIIAEKPFVPDALINILGCWQGWYFQSKGKTFFDLFFVATGINSFTGFSIEPLNLNWGSDFDDDIIADNYLTAMVNGSISDDIIFSFNKKYLFENSWEITYEGVILQEGKTFEGEWEIKHLNGSFNAIKTKSLLPIGIFDTEFRVPLVKTNYLTNFKKLTSTWFVQISGKNNIVGLLHMFEINGQVFANLLYEWEGVLQLSYLEGEYESEGKVGLTVKKSILGEMTNLFIRFTIDWNNNEVNGTVKDEVYKIRSLKGVKL